MVLSTIFIQSNTDTELIVFIIKSITPYRQAFLLFLEIIGENYSSDITEPEFYNIFNVLISIPHIKENSSKISNKANIVYQSLMINLIKDFSINSDLLKSLLLSLNKVILENVHNPLIFADYLLAI
jgi:hypothetical protein